MAILGTGILNNYQLDPEPPSNLKPQALNPQSSSLKAVQAVLAGPDHDLDALQAGMNLARDLGLRIGGLGLRP